MDLQNLIDENIGSIVSTVVLMIYSYATLQVKVGALKEDVDAIAEIVGTKRALARKQKREDIEYEKLRRTLQK